jgi:hypothetical protein
MQDLANKLSFFSAINPAAARSASTNGIDININAVNKGNNGLVFEVTAGVITDGTLTFKLQDAPDNGSGAPGTYADVAALYVQTPAGQVNAFTSATVAGSTIKFGYLGNPNPNNQHWVRIVCTAVGTTTGGIYSAVAVLGFPYNIPSV